MIEAFMTRRNFYFILVFCGCIALGQSALVERAQASKPPLKSSSTTTSTASSDRLLDAYPDAYAAYGLRLLHSDYTGPALRVRRGSDGVEGNFGFTSDGGFDAAALENWLSGANGYVVRWYSQASGEPDLIQSQADRQPLIAEGGAVTTDPDGRVAIRFDRARGTYLDTEGDLSAAVPLDNMLSMFVGRREGGGEMHILNYQRPGNWSHHKLSFRVSDGGFQLRGEVFNGVIYGGYASGPAAWIINSNGDDFATFLNHEQTQTKAITGSPGTPQFRMGASTKNGDRFFDGFVSAFVVMPGQVTTKGVQDRYDRLNAIFNLGPRDYTRGTILPQRTDWQVALYNWLETISVDDVTLASQAFGWDGQVSDIDQVADLWMQLEGASASRVVRAEPGWYVLDAGNGKGIEATGSVRIWHEPESGPGNPPRSWSNEPAFLYQLSIPNGDGTEGNPYFRLSALGRRALIVAAVDMMMYREDGYMDRTDMYGKALLGWAEAYRWCKDELPPETRDAFEDGFEYYLDRIIDLGAHAVNTNMDMFAMQGAAEVYMATDRSVLKEKAVQAVRRTLFGAPDGELESNHTVFAAGSQYSNGVFSPSGYIMEGDQPDVFYGGESLYHLAGALAAVTDRETGSVNSNWQFLREVVRRLSAWRMYQHFYDPGINSPGSGGLNARHYYHGPAGFSGRTGAGVPEGQASHIWRDLVLADQFQVSHPLLYNAKGGHLSRGGEAKRLPQRWEMERDIQDEISSLTSKLANPYEGTPPEWNGWSPWTKPTPYLPPTGWYSRLNALDNGSNSSIQLPIDRPGYYYNKAFGGPPTGEEYWAYKQNDGSRDWGFYVEAQARQGPYAGWYGGKLEAFWTETTGVVIVNRHGKTGCDDQFEDSICWDVLEERAAHRVWGRDENGNGFTTLLLRGRELQRTSTFDIDGTTPTVEVVNIFNDPSLSETTSRSGEQTGSEIEGTFEVTNTFEAQRDGLHITHHVTSDQSDELTELWASIPVFMRAVSSERPGDQPQLNYEDTSIEYWNGSSWERMPEDTNSNGTPEFVTTTALRLGRDFLFGDGPQYVYVAMTGGQRVRLAKDYYEDPYQTKTRVRTVHIDLHGNPGSVQQAPADKSVSYMITTADPTKGVATGDAQILQFRAGWNLVSSLISPSNPDMRKMFESVASAISRVQREDGAVYDLQNGVDEIGAWEKDEAYAVYAEEATMLSVAGDPIDPSTTSIDLKEGWNWVPFLLDKPTSVQQALASIEDALVLAKDRDGHVFYPAYNIASLQELRPGEGYVVFVQRDVVLTYPVGN